MNRAIAQVVATSALALSVMTSQAQAVRSRSLVAWGENILGLNKAPTLPAGIQADDVDAVYSAELVNGVFLRPDISGYAGSRFIVRGAGGLTGDANGFVRFVNDTSWSSADYYNKYTPWDASLLDRAWNVDFGRISFGFLNGVILRQPVPTVAVAPVMHLNVVKFESNGGLATLTTQTPHGFSVGTRIVVDVENNGLDGVKVVLSVPSPTTFTYQGIDGVGLQNSSGKAGFYSTTRVANGMVIRTANETTITTENPHNIPVGTWVKVSGLNDATFNGVFQVKSVYNLNYPYTLTYANPGNNAQASGGGLAVVAFQPVDSDLGFFGDTLPKDQNGIPTTTITDPSFVKVASSTTHTLALRSNGTVRGFFGDNFYGETTMPSGVDSAVDITAGEYFSAALLKEGKVVVWGLDAYGLLQVPTNLLSGVVSVKAGASHLVALKSDGTVVAWGNSADGRTSVPSGLSKVKKIAVGRSHNLALKEDGTVAAWGYNGSGQSTIPSGLASVIDIAAGGDHNLVLVSTEKPYLKPLTIQEKVGTADPEDFDAATKYTDRGRTLIITAPLSLGAAPVQYRWRKNGSIVSGVTDSQYTLVVGANDTGTIKIDVEAINKIGSDQESVVINIASRPSELAVRVGQVINSQFSVFGQAASGDYLAASQGDIDPPPNPLPEVAISVTGKGYPAPKISVYRAGVADAVVVASNATGLTGASGSVAGSALITLTGSTIEERSTGTYLVVSDNGYGAVTNTVKLGVYKEVARPALSANFTKNAAITDANTYLGTVATNSSVVLSLDTSVVAPGYLSYQWFKAGVAISKATNSTLTLVNFGLSQIGDYSLKAYSPLSSITNSGFPQDKAKGVSESIVYKPVLPVVATLSKTLVSGSTSTKGSLDVRLGGSLKADVTLEKYNGSQWVYPVTGSPTPVSIFSVLTPNTPLLVDLAATGRGTVNLETAANLDSSINGKYRVKVRQQAQNGGNWVVLDGSDLLLEFTIAVDAPAGLSTATLPQYSDLGGTISTSSGTDYKVSARAYATIDLGAHLQNEGSPEPVYRWEKQSASNPSVYARLTNGVSGKSLSLFSHPTNTGVYRLVASNAFGVASKTIQFSPDRVLSTTNSAMVFPDGSIDIPVNLIGFGDESAVSFTLQVDSPYLAATASDFSVNLDDSISSSSRVDVRKDGAVSAAAASSNMGLNRIKAQVVISKNDPSTSFKAGTNRLAVLRLKARSQSDFGTIRNTTAPAIPPSLDISVGFLDDVVLVVADKDLPLRLALTNATFASVVSDPLTGQPGIKVLADSIEGDVDGNFTVNVLDVTTMASVLSTKTISSYTVIGKQRLDCAPYSSQGDGNLNLADLVQVARYAAKLDTIQAAGGSSSVNLNSNRPRIARESINGPRRKFRFGWADLVTGQEVEVPVVLNAEGDENAMAFNVEFDPKALQYISAQATGGAAFMENRTGANSGKVGMLLWKPAGSAVASGSTVVALVKFKVTGAPGSTTLRFSPTPLDSLIATVQAQSVLDVDFEAALLQIGQRNRVVGGAVIGQSWSGKTWNLEIQPVDSAGNTVSAQNRTLSILSSDRMDADANQWIPAGVKPTVSPTGNLLLPFTIDPNRTSQFFRIQED